MQKLSLNLLVVLSCICFVLGFIACFYFIPQTGSSDAETVIEPITNERDLVVTLPDDFLVETLPKDVPPFGGEVADGSVDGVENPPVVGETPDDNQEELPEEDQVPLNVTESYANSQADGTGSTLWNLTVNYGGLNASDLLAQDGYYLVFKVSYSVAGDTSEKWYAFVNAFYFDEEEGYNSTGYLSSIVYSAQFAVVTVAPTGNALGSYENAFSENEIVAMSEIYYNQYFQGSASEEQVALNVTESYANSQADGTGSMLWSLTVSYGGLNASDLLAQDGYYLVFKVSCSATDSASDKWYAFVNAFYLEEGEGYNSTGYLNRLVYSVQFAVVTVAPTDKTFGSYESALGENEIVAISEIYYNQYFSA
jgi:hypothetical protein